jgi:hypothetical protein
MKYTRLTAVAALSLAATLSLTACNGDDVASGSSSAASSSNGASNGGAKTDGGSTAQGGSDSSNGSQAGSGKTGSGNDTASGASANGGTITFCKTANLAIDAQNASPDGTEGRINITMVNRGSTTCSATGFAGVDIKDADHTSSPIERASAQPRVTTLKPGESAIFDLAYTIDDSGNSQNNPTNLLVTPPNETHTVTLNWPSDAGAIKGAYTDVKLYPTHTTK